MERISYLLGSVQRSLFPHLREEVGELTEKERRFVLVLEVVEVADGGIPLSGITTSASMHDSQAAIPLAKMTAQWVESFYDLMDAAYDAESIRRTSLEMGHVPIIDRNARGGEEIEMEPDRARRYNNRSASERFNSDLKDNHGGSMVRVRGHKKVHAHLMFGVMVIFAKAVIGLVT